MKEANTFSNVNSHYCSLHKTLNLFQNNIRANYYYVLGRMLGKIKIEGFPTYPTLCSDLF